MKYIEIDARNVWFTKPDENVFEKLYDKAENEFVKKYLKSTFRNYLINEYPNVTIVDEKLNPPSWVDRAIEKGDTVYKLDLKRSDIIKWEHYIDYLNTLPPRPIRMSFSDLEKHVKEWEKSFTKQKANEEDGIELLHDYNNGFKWVKVFGKKSLEREGHLMNHCASSYYEHIKYGVCEIYSLRDKNNKPHVTIEYRPPEETIYQIKGNSNQSPKDKYLKYAEDFLKKKYIQYNYVDQSDLIQCGLSYQNNKLYRLEDVPEGFVIKDDIDLSFLEKNLKFPKGLIIDGDFLITSSHITSLPENLTVKRNFYADNSKLEYVPKSCKFEGNVSIRECEDLIEWNVDEIGGDFDASYSSLKVLPDYFEVHGNCRLKETDIEEIVGITVDGDLSLISCFNLRGLFDLIKVGKTLYLPREFKYYIDMVEAHNIKGGIGLEYEDEE